MERKRVSLVVGGVCLIAGAMFEYARTAYMRPAAAEERESERTVRVQSPTAYRTVAITNDAIARADNATLRRRIAALEKELAKQAAVPVVQEPAAQSAVEGRRDDSSRRRSGREDMEKMKTEDPERYAEMQKRREEFRQTMAQRAQERATFIDSVDLKNMTDEQRENHDKLINTVARLNEMRAQMDQEGFERTPEMREEMGQLYSSLGELYSAERRYLFEETARAVGYDGGQVSEFADQMQMIIDNTTMSGFGRHGGGDHHPASTQAAQVSEKR